MFFDGAPNVTAAGWVALRFVTDNPGVWPFHCHITWHQVRGARRTGVKRVCTCVYVCRRGFGAVAI